MKWRKGETSVELTQEDIKLMQQCKMPLGEMLKREHPNDKIPPLWSVLSYAMLLRDCSAAGVWAAYREMTRLARNASKHYFRLHILKAGGGFRALYVPRYNIREHQNFILKRILSGLPVDDHAHAYRQGVRLEDCAAPHQNKNVVIRLDLKNFFGSITEDMVYQTFLEETGYAKSLCRFLAQMCCRAGSLPQGTTTSPTLSNIVFRKCDVALTELAQRYQMAYTRYSDDMYFSAEGDVNVKRFLRQTEQLLCDFGFRINREKTTVRRQQHRQQVLGLTVNDRIQVNRDYRRKLMQELYYLERFGNRCIGAVETGDYLKYMQQLQGKLAYVMQMDPDNGKFRKAHLKLTERIRRYVFLQENGFVP